MTMIKNMHNKILSFAKISLLGLGLLMINNESASASGGGGIDELCTVINKLDNRLQEQVKSILQSQAGNGKNEIRIVVNGELMRFYLSENEKLNIGLYCY